MPYRVTRTDTGQFVLMDVATDTVVIEDDLAAGFAKLEQACADKPAGARVNPDHAQADDAPEPASAFGFRGGPRYLPLLLAVVLPFLWLGALYFALADLLADHALDRRQSREVERKLEELEQELQTLRSEMVAGPRPRKGEARPAAPPAAVAPTVDEPAPAATPSAAVAPAVDEQPAAATAPAAADDAGTGSRTPRPRPATDAPEPQPFQ